uniref:Uncharacterized protein n=1 Tax=Rhizophora mucronata TaxID=61149 RepID=A0A2P2N4H1_RHIMU
MGFARLQFSPKSLVEPAGSSLCKAALPQPSEDPLPEPILVTALFQESSFFPQPPT